MTTETLIQRSQDWYDERLGSLGASEVYDATAMLKSGKGYTSKREDMLVKKLVERLTGRGQTKTKAATIQHGIDFETPGRVAYEFAFDVSVKEVGLFKHNRIARTHASPDGVRNDSNIGIEIKCPTSATHLETIMLDELPEQYRPQCLWQMACAGFEAVHYVSYDPRFPEGSQLYVQVVERDDKAISILEEQVEEFLHELNERETAFRERFQRREAA